MEKILKKTQTLKQRDIYEYCLESNILSIGKISVIILCAPCRGFGDVIFATKLKRYIQEWYGITADIGTTTPELFIKLGEPEKNIIKLRGIKGNQCRRFSRLTAERSLKGYDLILVAPLMADNEISFPDVRHLISYSDRSNTFFFSEYNDSLDKGFDVNTGVGDDRDGMLFVKTKSAIKDISKYNLGKYALAYIAESIDDSETCFLNFLKMVVTKYKDLKNIVCPPWIENISDSEYNKIKGVDNIYLVTPKEEIVIKERKPSGRSITLRCDVLPVSNNIMISLIHYSVKDVLLTGDQSITDALSCCSSKNIFYQIAPWKEDLAFNLAKHLPNKFLRSPKTSCGSTAALKYTSNYKAFVKRWDFRTLAKPKIDAMISSASIIKDNKWVKAKLK